MVQERLQVVVQAQKQKKKMHRELVEQLGFEPGLSGMMQMVMVCHAAQECHLQGS